MSQKCQRDIAYTQLIFHIRRQVLTQNFSCGEGEGADPEAVSNLCWILKIVLEKPCLTYNCNLTLFVTVYISTNTTTSSMAISPNLNHKILAVFYCIFQNSKVLTINFSGWFRMKGNSHKTFDIIMCSKSVFFSSQFGTAIPPLLHVSLSEGWYHIDHFSHMLCSDTILLLSLYLPLT
jgi:hypothetical protein